MRRSLRGGLAPGESFSDTFSGSATIDISTRQYLVLMVDWGDKVDELNESNNTRAATFDSATAIAGNCDPLDGQFAASRAGAHLSPNAGAISYVLPVQSRAMVDVYGVNGRKVQGVFDDVMQAGRHSLELRSQGLPAGHYFCRIALGDTYATFVPFLIAQ